MLKKLELGLLVALGVTIGGCASQSQLPSTQNEKSFPPTELTTTSPQVSASELTSADFASVANGSADFGFDLIKTISDLEDYDDENIFISPMSISSAFGLAYAGSGTQTETEIAEVMNFDLPNDRIHRTLGTLQADVEDDQAGQIFDMANTIFVDQRLEIEDAYKRLVKENYGADEQKADMYNQPAKAVDIINLWVSEQTRGLIPQTLKLSDMNVQPNGKSYVASVMVNTAYLKADWKTKFSKSRTRVEAFQTPKGPVQIPMMRQVSGFSYYDGSGFSAVDLPYQNDTMVMTVLLPDAQKGAVRLAQGLNAKKLNKVFDRLEETEKSYQRVDLKLPKADLANDYELTPMLETMEMRTPFSIRADFNGRFNVEKLRALDPRYEGTKISKVIHKTVLKLDEETTEAAAVTAIVDDIIVVSGVRRPPPQAFHVDHDFVVVLRHRDSKAVLFAGVVNNPCPEDGC